MDNIHMGYRDATIQRFEYTVELFWKYLKAIIEQSGHKAHFPKLILQETYAGGLIENERIWLEMLKKRNLTSHTYENTANQIYVKITEIYVGEIKQVLAYLLKQYNSF